MKRSSKSPNAIVMKKPKLSKHKKFKQSVFDLLNKIGIRSTYIEQLDKTYDDIAWKQFYNNFTEIDVVTFILDRPDHYPETFLEYLTQCNFKKSKAKYWSDRVLFESYAHDQKLDFIIEHVCTPYKPISQNSFLFNHTLVNTWYRHDDHENYNSDTIEHCEEVLANVISNLVRDDTLYYHCTTYKSALSILEEGVDCNVGKRCLDFGIRPSFYMTPHVHTVLEYYRYLHKIGIDEVCIIVFKLTDHLLHSLKYIRFKSATDEWKYLTTNSRLCQNKSNKLDSYDFVYGPMVANIHQIKQENKLAKTHCPPKFQLASKSERSDNILSKSIHSFIWIKK